jgi:polyhydroxyalkanoate synthesis repressor PhaR
MIRLVRRYGGVSRKLYDTEESRYVSLEEIARWVRAGQQLRVVDSASNEDVTAQTLAQVIYETHRAGTSLLSPEVLHEVIRRGGRALSHGVEQLQQGAGRLVRRSVGRLQPAAVTRREMADLRRSLADLEASLAELEATPRRGGDGRRGRRARRRPRRG